MQKKQKEIVPIEPELDEEQKIDIENIEPEIDSEIEPEVIDDEDDEHEELDEEHDEIAFVSLPQVARPSYQPTTKDALQLYLNEIKKFPLLLPEEEYELAKRVQETGDQEAAFKLISSHLRLVVKIAMDFQRKWMQNVLDLIQEGNVGLIRAVDKFAPEKGIKFSYYAAFWIKAYILKFIMDNWRMVKIGTTQAQRKLFYNLNRERQKLIAQGFDPDTKVLSQRLGIEQEQIIEMQQRLDSSDVSLDAPTSDGQSTSSRIEHLPAVGPGIEDSIALNEIAEIVQDKLKDILPSLSEKEKYILENRLLTDEPVTLREIGERYNVTRERVRQLEARLLQKLRAHLAFEIKDFSEDWINEK